MKDKPAIVYLTDTGYIFAKVKGGLCWVFFCVFFPPSVIILPFVNTTKFNFKLVFHFRSYSVIIFIFGKIIFIQLVSS